MGMPNPDMQTYTKTLHHANSRRVTLAFVR